MENKDLIALQSHVTLLRSEGKYLETIESAYDLLDKGITYHDRKSILTAHINTAASYYCLGAIEEAFHSIEAYDEVCQQDGDEADWLNLYNILFLLYEFTKDYSNAKKTLEKSIAIGTKLEKFNIVSNGYSNLSHLYMEETNFDEALHCAEKGLAAATLHTPKSPVLSLRVQLNWSKAQIGLGNLEEAKKRIDEMIRAEYLSSFPREKAQCYDLLGLWQSKMGNYVEAMEAYTNAKEIAESYHDVHLLKTIQEARCNLCDLIGDTEQGYFIQKEYIELLNEISSRELALAAQKLEVKHRIAGMEKNATIDFLTGIYNRQYLEKTVDQRLQAVTGNEVLSCLAFDIDNFKAINDAFGHVYGDTVIQMVSDAINSCLTDQALFGRYGGDEFVVIVSGSASEQGMGTATEMEKQVKNLQVIKDGKIVTVEISIGISDSNNLSERSFQELFHQADLALYEAKKNGKNQICVTSLV
ncbi:GGDEF domain-containing protein [Paenisporosarcina cavernae]|uniref:GGDEF domain-containing protein n=1 Tax=Paenisporosarcina cavernae TaxID=2320858 RepID=A0A385YPT6_9BACL|nr:GGDEF domain-containing protein [Paenisporosarcina cavernae]AYC28461.1 GGDEF domain-containing protein [Paenisporosarcina cavernae]